MTFIKDIKEISNRDIAQAGGKGASLGEMMQAGFPVPPGFVIISQAFETFLEKTDLNVKINAILSRVNKKNITTIENASEKITTLILSAEIPKEIRNEIQKNFDELKSPCVAVRSSATAEDSSTAAWAGQLESFLNVTQENLFDSIKKCWASLFTPRAIFYRLEKKLQNQKISVAVVIQKMVQSEISGVAFSAHPVTQDRNQLVIEVIAGLGQAIVSGEVTPETYIIEKKLQLILDKNINNNANQLLTDNEIIKLTKLILKIEKHYGFPVDVEWAKEKGKFYITQSRPITTLQSLPDNKLGVLEYIKNQKWFSGVRGEDSLFFYSAKCNGYVKFAKKEHGIEFAESLLVPHSKNYPVRIFNLWQAKSFHAVSNKKILKDPQAIISFIKKNDLLYQEIEKLGEKLSAAVSAGNFSESADLFKKIIGLFEKASALFFIIFSLGLKLAENKNKIKDSEKINKAHYNWRNNVAFQEEAMTKNLVYFFKFLAKKEGLKIAPKILIKYLTYGEVDSWLNEKSSNADIRKLISLRKKQGFVYLNLKNHQKEVIDDPKEIMEIKKYFLELDKASKPKKKEISGQIAYGWNENIQGEVIVIKNKTELIKKQGLIDGKILVSIQTTPHFIPYLKNVKAIITDEGGLTCHAAIIAREFKIPCIVGTKNVTKILKEGDFVELKPETGFVVLK